MSAIKCELCGRFMAHAEDFAFVEEVRWTSHLLDPPEMVPAHKRCVAKEYASALPAPRETA